MAISADALVAVRQLAHQPVGLGRSGWPASSPRPRHRRRAACRRAFSQARRLKPRPVSTAMRTFSRTVSSGKISVIWKVRPMPIFTRPAAGTRLMFCAVQQDLARGRREEAGDQVEERRLAGAVRADDRAQLAVLDPHRHVGHGDAGCRSSCWRRGPRAWERSSLMRRTSAAACPAGRAGRTARPARRCMPTKNIQLVVIDET